MDKQYRKRESVFLTQIKSFLEQQGELLSTLSKETVGAFYKNLIHTLYFTADYVQFRNAIIWNYD